MVTLSRHADQARRRPAVPVAHHGARVRDVARDRALVISTNAVDPAVVSVARLLTSFGFVVTLADDAAGVPVFLAVRRPALVVVDLRVARRQGDALARAVDRSPVPVVLLVWNGDEPLHLASLNSANDALTWTTATSRSPG